MLPEVDIFIGNYTIIDKEVYELWISGYTVPEAVSLMKQRGALEKWGSSLELLVSDVSDHYLTFEMLEKLLPTPVMLSEEWTFQLHPSLQKFIIEKFYSFDGVVIREILGKKLSGRIRKDLDDVAEKTGISLRSCRRQFDNVKRIYKHLDDMCGSSQQIIENDFLLSPNLAKEYAAIIFLANNRFETSKKKLGYLSFENFSNCANAIMTHWTYDTSDQDLSRDASELDREFLVQLREQKIVLDREKEHRSGTLTHLREKLPDRLCNEVETNFKSYSRSVINLGANLLNAKDLRDFFPIMVEKVIEPFKQAKWDSECLNLFFQVYAVAGSTLDVISSNSVLKTTWERYMKVIQLCVRELYRT